jgi:rhamnopyranosyl-N-acetylglucosaminyl-diphospho-decaprenol beta-1,3/1,4-galactofuranosyltransferase
MVYIVDNASTDGTPEFVKSLGPAARYRYLPQNTGSAGGFEEALRWAYEAGHRWLWITDDDSIPHHDALEQLLRSVSSHRDVLMAAPKKVTPEGRLWRAEMIYDSADQTAREPQERLYEGNEPFECDWTANTGLLVRREAIQAGGLPLADLFAFGEDTEYCLRLRRHGRLILVPRATVVHRDPSMEWPVPVALLWRSYYVRRNSIYLSSRSRILPPRGVASIVLSTIREAIAILRKLNAKRLRLRVLIAASYHGLIGRLGPAPGWLRQP